MATNIATWFRPWPIASEIRDVLGRLGIPNATPAQSRAFARRFLAACVPGWASGVIMAPLMAQRAGRRYELLLRHTGVLSGRDTERTTRDDWASILAFVDAETASEAA